MNYTKVCVSNGLEIPNQWKGLFECFKSEQSLRQAEIWIQEQITPAQLNGSTSRAWEILLCFLSKTLHPVGDLQCTLTSILMNYPEHIQKYLLAVIYQHRREIDCDVLKQFVAKICPVDRSLNWTNVLRKLLCSHFQIECPLLNGETVVCSQTEDVKLSQGRLQTNEECSNPVADVEGGTGRVKDVDREREMVGEVRSEEGEASLIILDDDDEDAESPPKKIKIDVPEDQAPSVISVNSSDLDDRLKEKGFQLYETLQNGSENEANIENELLCILNSPVDQIEPLCRLCGLDDLSEMGFSRICDALVRLPVVGYSSCVSLLSGIMGKKLEQVDHSPSRVFISAVILLAQTFPKQLLDAVFMHRMAEELGATNGEILCRLSKDVFSQTEQGYLLRKLVMSTKTLTEHALALLHDIFDAKPEFDGNLITETLECLSSCSGPYENNLKFGKLILKIISNYTKQLHQVHVATLTQITSGHKTFLRKTIDTSLKKICV